MSEQVYNKKQKKHVRYMLFTCVANFLIYGLSVLFNNITVYLKGCGYSDVQLGILLAVGPFVALVAPLFWGMMSDRARYKNNVLLIAIFCSAAAFVGIQLHVSMLYHAVMLGVVMFFLSSQCSLIDTITMEYTSLAQTSYGPIRVLGTVGFGVISILSMLVSERSAQLFFYLYAAIAVICIISLKFMPQVEGHSQRGDKISLKVLLKNKTLLLLCLFMGIGHFLYGCFISFYPNYLIYDLGKPQYIWGITICLTCFGEIPFFFAFDKLMKRLNIKTILIISLSLTVIRYLCFSMSFAAETLPLFLISLLTGLVPTIGTYCGSYYILHTIPENMVASAQTFLYSVAFWFPRLLASLLGGLVNENFGIHNTMLLCSILAFVSVIMLLFVKKKQFHVEKS